MSYADFVAFMDILGGRPGDTERDAVQAYIDAFFD